MRRVLPLLLAVAAVCVACDSTTSAEAPAAALGCPSGTYAVQRADAADGSVARWCWDRVTGRAHGPYERTLGDVVLAEGRYDQGRADGPWRWRDPDFAPAGSDVTGAFVRGEADGEWVATARDGGGPLWHHHFVVGAACGLWRDWTTGEVVEAQYPPCDGSDPAVERPFEPRWDGETCDVGDVVVAGTERWCEVDGVRDGPYRDDGGDGLPLVEGQFASGARVGTWTERFPGGAVAAEGGYVDDARDGVWTRWYGSGLVRETATWAEGQLDGPYASYYPDGAREEAGDHADGEREGAWTRWHPSGGEAEAGSWRAGLRLGVWRSWDVHGRPETEITWYRGYQQGTTRIWSDHHITGARVVIEGEVDGGRPVGAWISTWVDGGEPAGVLRYVDGLREGAYSELWPNGNMMFEGTYLGGQLFLAWRAGYESGQRYIDASRYDGLLHGPYMEYWENGQMKAQGAYERGNPTGTWQYWDTDGQPLSAYPEEGA